MIHTFPQRSPEWYAYKLGRISASRIADIIAKTKSGPSASRANYRAELLCERLTGQAQESYTNAAMQWGIDNEQAARDAYSWRTDCNVTEIGFADHPVIEMAGCSADGIMGNCQALIEIKAPNSATHLDTLLGAPVADKYIVQMQWQMACLPGTEFCDFVSYDPRLPENARLFIKRIMRDEKRIRELEEEVRVFAFELAQLVKRIKAYGPRNPSQ
jgi:putative phage-type endonuclease